MQGIPENPYSAPQSALVESTDTQALSIEAALARGYDFNIGDVVNESWQRVKGSKGMIIGAMLVYGVASQTLGLLFGFVFGLIGALGGEVMAAVLPIVGGLIASGLCASLLGGIYLLGIRQAAGQPLNFNEVFANFGLFVPLFILSILMAVLIYVGFFLLLLPGIYLGVAYLLALPLAVERKLSPWQALEASRKAISQRWFKVFGLMLVLSLIMMVSAIPLGIGLVWTFPMFIIAVGILYRTIFGVLPPPQ
ncbi:DUF975 family protein [Pseudomonas sp. PDM13]|uniref:DUF975 family protein n=1 Tax=Pseudomonas sp. PDM13 TaxID=2769255 RepID=UPI0021E03480|nr:DUF975 family protein [Pseudomonas sp. PDM13]MCU9946561.1 DUF975 family protein [Pseudomonas sp. PDM13]